MGFHWFHQGIEKKHLAGILQSHALAKKQKSNATFLTDDSRNLNLERNQASSLNLREEKVNCSPRRLGKLQGSASPMSHFKIPPLPYYRELYNLASHTPAQSPCVQTQRQVENASELEQTSFGTLSSASLHPFMLMPPSHSQTANTWLEFSNLNSSRGAAKIWNCEFIAFSRY